MSQLLFCMHCGVGYGSLGELPAQCPGCGKSSHWTTAQPSQWPVPKPAWDLSVFDRAFLTQLRIQRI